MEKLSIREASERFGLSRARLYQLLEKGTIVGHRSTMRGRSAKSWVDGNSLCKHLETRDERRGQGRPKAKAEGNYLPIWLAAQKTSYSIRHISRLVKQGSIASIKSGQDSLVHYPSLLGYINK
jgi:transposase